MRNPCIAYHEHSYIVVSRQCKLKSRVFFRRGLLHAILKPGFHLIVTIAGIVRIAQYMYQLGGFISKVSLRSNGNHSAIVLSGFLRSH